jgi:hypothetical protein
MSDADEMGFIAPTYYGPRPKPEKREPVEAPPEPVWNFNEPKLRKLLTEAGRVLLVIRDPAEKVREAPRHRDQLSADQRHMQFAHGFVDARLMRALAAGERELARLVTEQTLLSERVGPAVAVAARCRQWAESQGWSLDGIGGRSAGPRPTEIRP